MGFKDVNKKEELNKDFFTNRKAFPFSHLPNQEFGSVRFKRETAPHSNSTKGKKKRKKKKSI